MRAEDAGRRRLPTALAYLLAVVLPAATLLLRLAPSSRFGDHPALELFLIPIILSAVAGGLGPGLVSTALAAIATDYFLLPPKYSFVIEGGLHSLEWLVLILAGTLMSVLLRKRSSGTPGGAAGSFDNERPGVSPDSEAGVSRTILISAGSTCAALGAVTLVGWFFHISALTRVGPSFNPMVANTAVGLFLDGLALLFLAAGRPKAALGGAVWSLLAGILTLAEFVFSIDLHIDELLVRDYLRALPAFPGRPAPNAALCLVFCGVALLWASIPRWREKAAVIIGVLGAVVFALGAAAVSGYVIGLPMYAFGSSKPMAANAGLGFLAMGLGVMALAWRRSQPSPEAEARILFSAERKVRAGFALALAALILIGGMSYFSLVRQHEDRVWVDHTHQVIASQRRVLSTLTDAETSARGYIISGREEFLEPYQQAVRDVSDELHALRNLTADNTVQQDRLDALALLVAERLAILQEAVKVRRADGFAALQQKLPNGRGKQLQDRIRGILAEMEASEQSLLQERSARSHHAGAVAKTAIVGGITLAFIFVVVALFVISGDFAGSRRARAALQQARDQLETRVRERTAELAEANVISLNSEERLAGVINSAMDAILTVDEQQRIVLFNPAAEKMFGCSAADAMGEPLNRLIPERLRSAHVRHVQDFGETHVTRRQMGQLGSISGVRANGEEFPIEAAISRVDVAGRTLFTAIVRDITERKRAEEELRRSEERLQRVTEGMTEGLVISNMEGEMLHWNPAAIEIHGFTSADVWRRQLPEFQNIFELSTLEGTAVPFEQWPLPRILRGERLREHELRIRRIGSDWERVFSYGGTTVRDSLGSQVAFCTIADITERKRAEEEIRLLNADLEGRVAQRTAELEAANRELEAFSYSVSHDLRAPLRTMDGFSNALLEDHGPQLPAEARDYLATIRRGAQRMGALIDDLLAFARLGQKPVTRQSVNMEALVQEALEELGPECDGRKIQFLNAALPATQGDPVLLKQVWMNLLSNAIKYSRHAEQARIEIGSLAEPGAKAYFIRDNGAGFDMKFAGKLFGVFQRLHRADEFEGTGIGLATVQRIVHRHGGRVWAEAKPEQGATFYFTLEGEE